MCHIIAYIQDFVFEIGGFLGKLGQMIDIDHPSVTSEISLLPLLLARLESAYSLL